MRLKHILIILLVISLIFVCACKENDTNDITPTETPTIAPLTSTPRPTPDPEASLYVANAEITSGNELYSTSVVCNKLNTHAGYANILIEMSSDIDSGIADYIYINDELVETHYIDISSNKIRMLLKDTLPYFYTLQIKSGYKIGDKEMTEDYTLDFLHEEALKCDISYYNFQENEDTPNAIYLTQKDPSFLIEFNKPVIRDTLKFARSFIAQPVSVWLSDTQVLITFNNLNNGRHTIGIESVEAQAEIFGNKLIPKSTYGQTYQFNIDGRQNIYSVNPTTNKVNVVTTLEYGSFFESISNDAKNLIIGIVTDDADGFSYTRAFFNLNLKTMTTFNSVLSSTISDDNDDTTVILDEKEYSRYITSDYWNNDDKYIYFYNNDIYTIDLASYESELLYKNVSKGKILYPVLPLANGNYAAINTPMNTNDYLSLSIINSSGKLINDYQLPMKEYLHEGKSYFSPIMEEVENGNIYIEGFNLDSENGLAFKILKINPDDGAIEILTESARFINMFPKLGYGIFYTISNDGSEFIMHISDLDGNLLKSYPVDGTFGRQIYNPHKNVFYLVNSDYMNQSCTISILDADTFEMTTSDLEFSNFVEPIGISESGELLLMDIL